MATSMRSALTLAILVSACGVRASHTSANTTWRNSPLAPPLPNSAYSMTNPWIAPEVRSACEGFAADLRAAHALGVVIKDTIYEAAPTANDTIPPRKGCSVTMDGFAGGGSLPASHFRTGLAGEEWSAGDWEGGSYFVSRKDHPVVCGIWPPTARPDDPVHRFRIDCDAVL